MNAIYTSCVGLCILVVVVHSVAIIEVASQFSSSLRISSLFCDIRIERLVRGASYHIFSINANLRPNNRVHAFQTKCKYIFAHYIYENEKTNDFDTLQHFLHPHYFEWVLIYVLEIAAKTDFFLSFRFQCVEFVSVRVNGVH